MTLFFCWRAKIVFKMLTFIALCSKNENDIFMSDLFNSCIFLIFFMIRYFTL